MKSTVEKGSTSTVAPKSKKPFFSKNTDEAFFQNKSSENTTDFLGEKSPFFKARKVQAKLKIGEPGDRYEVEADAMADRVVKETDEPTHASGNLGTNPISLVNNSSVLQNKTVDADKDAIGENEKEDASIYADTEKIETATGEDPLNINVGNKLNISSNAKTTGMGTTPTAGISKKNTEETNIEENNGEKEEKINPDEILTRLPATEDVAKEAENPEGIKPVSTKEPTGIALQLKKEKAAPDVSLLENNSQTGSEGSDLEAQLNGSKGGGKALDGKTRSSMESGFGADFSAVRIHNGAEAASMNKQLGSHAFTHGNNIYFNEGKYNPGSGEGKHLLAHELTHTVQQGAASVQPKTAPLTSTGQPRIQRGFWSSAWNGVKSAGSWVGGKVKSGASAAWSGVKWVGGKVADAFMWIFDKAKALLNKGINWLKNKWESLKNFASGGLAAIKNIFSGIVNFFKNPLGFITNAIVNMNEVAIRQSWTQFTNFILKIWDGFHKVGTTLINQVQNIWNTISGFATSLFNKVDALTNHWAFKKLPNSLQNIIRGLVQTLRNLWNVVKAGWLLVFNKIKTFIDKAFKTIRGFIKKVLSFAIDTIILGIVQFGKVLLFIQDFLKNPKKYLQPLSEKIGGYLGGVEGGFKAQVDKYFGDKNSTQNTQQTTAIPAAGVIQKKDDDTAKSSASWSEIGSGVWDIMKKKWEEVKKDPLSIVLNLLLDMVLPIVGNVKDIIQLFKDIKKIVAKPFSAGSLDEFWTSLVRWLDIPILIYNTFWSIVGRTLMLPLIIASFIPHPIVKGIAIAAGYALLGALIAGELANIGQKLLLLKTGSTDEEEKKRAYNSLGDSLIALALEAAMAIIILIISAVANVVKGVFGFVRGKVFKPKVSAKKPNTKGKIDVEGGPKTDAPGTGKTKNLPEESKVSIENTKTKQGKDLTPEDVKAEFDAFKDGKLKRSADPDYEWEIELPNGHKWKRKKNGKWCRFTTQHCFNEDLPFKSDKEFYEFLKKEGLVTESFEEFVKSKPKEMGGEEPAVKPSAKKPSYKLGESDGGPGTWENRTGSGKTIDIEFQQKVTGAPPNTEYVVKGPNPKGEVKFDGYNPDTNVLLDAKRFENFPKIYKGKIIGEKTILDEAQRQLKSARKGTKIEWHIASKEQADLLRNLFRENGINIKIVFPPVFLK